MNADVLSNCLEQAIPIVREAGKLLHDRVCSSSIQEKGKTDFVTAVDTAVQYFIRERLQKLNSSIQFMGEEQDNSSIEPDRLKGNRCCLASFMIRFRRNCLPHNVVMEHFATTNRSMLAMCRHFRTAFVL